MVRRGDVMSSAGVGVSFVRNEADEEAVRRRVQGE